MSPEEARVREEIARLRRCAVNERVDAARYRAQGAHGVAAGCKAASVQFDAEANALVATLKDQTDES